MSKGFYVEVYRPAYPDRSIKLKVHKERDYSTDVLQPGMTCVFRVDHVTTKDAAIALCIEKLAGHNVSVYKVHGPAQK